MLEAYVIITEKSSPINLYKEVPALFSSLDEAKFNLDSQEYYKGEDWYIAKIRLSDKRKILDAVYACISGGSTKPLMADIVESYSINKNVLVK